MTQADLPTLSVEKRAAIDRAISAAFDVPAGAPMVPVTGGLSGAAVFRLHVEGADHLLRLEPPADAFRDPARSFRCMRIAADAGLAPPLRYACAEDGVAIMDFIEERPLRTAFAGRREALMEALGRLVGALHETPPFPTLMGYLDGLDALTGSLHGHGLLPARHRAATLDAYRSLTAAYRRLAPDLVSSHNDINPRNILWDGARLWLVDWESAFLADRYVDLASATTFFARDAGEEAALSEAYFGRAPTETERARLHLARLINHVFYGVMFLNAAAAQRAGAAGPEDQDEPSLAEIHQGLADLAFDLDKVEGLIAYGRARLRAMRDGVADATFAWAACTAR